MFRKPSSKLLRWFLIRGNNSQPSEFSANNRWIAVNWATPSRTSIGSKLVWEPNTCFWRSVAPFCEKIIFAFERRYITYVVRKSMLDMPVLGGLWNSAVYCLFSRNWENFSLMWIHWYLKKHLHSNLFYFYMAFLQYGFRIVVKLSATAV